MKTKKQTTKKEKGVTEIKIVRNVKVTDENIDDIMVVAFEGGINYWCCKAEVVNNDYKGCTYSSEVISEGGSIKLKDAEGTKEYTKILTKEKFIKGLTMFLKRHPEVIQEDGTIDCGAIDADFADQIIQYSVFDEQIFG